MWFVLTVMMVGGKISVCRKEGVWSSDDGNDSGGDEAFGDVSIDTEEMFPQPPTASTRACCQ
jgi:hypothetical protein